MAAQQSQSTDLQKRSVVSSFIFTGTDDSLRVALFRRSQQTRTYQGRLAPISGTIENSESPVRAAWRELEEETRLTAREVTLWRQGNPFTFDDISAGRRWTIHPFAFQLRLKAQDKIQIDWEHDGWDWYDPNKVTDDETFNGVPRLVESLRRVWFEMEMNSAASEALRSGLYQLKTDHQSGSHELTSIAVTALRDVLVHLRGDRNWWATTCTAAWHLWKNGRESMGSATLNAFLSILADIETILPLTLENESSWDRILAMVDHHLEARREIPTRIKETFVKYLQDSFPSAAEHGSKDTLTILTLSASSTIRESIIDAFSSLSISTLDLRILESRPLFEGAAMASTLLSSFQSKHLAASGRHLKLTIYTDASAAIAASDADFVLLGADSISSSGWVSNKTGSLPAVLSAKHISPGVKVLILSAVDKVALPVELEHEGEQEYNDPVEVTTPWAGSGVRGIDLLYEGIQGSPPKTANCRVMVNNIYFEWVPAGLIDGYLCEHGFYFVADIRKKADEVKKNADRYFGLVVSD
ncbi:hypothetical protein N7481_002992 [Penicillium waksmanii]|uniref:uncharacterized protein n=1 Tax=Penicillium waksmanii TaxID=69791 RepID=UPI002547719C|nr:uncharacterized protein N7481_002992 [Penicillium waksmanii]KAJ5987782.1 hypothetical protein N7481_002992 [Penicillium waksmanii]